MCTQIAKVFETWQNSLEKDYPKLEANHLKDYRILLEIDRPEDEDVPNSETQG